ncbi:MAG: Hsp20/alpha crystallin family protein [Patescibacteria group bacterium]|nr:Hsp20/alpha crystallin family protein [Patescibacteria group bacterium]
MSKKIKRNFWAKISRLDEDLLAKQGQEIKTIKQEVERKIIEKEKAWFSETSEGRLSLDIYQDKNNNIVVKSALAGVNPDDLEIIIDKDILTIKGERKNEELIEPKNYFHQECFWGKFSRTVILPNEVKIEGVKANFKNGILTITLPKKEETVSSKILKIKK